MNVPTVRSPPVSGYAAFVVTRDCGGNNFNKRPVARKNKNTRWTTLHAAMLDCEDDIQSRECFASARNASNETDDFFLTAAALAE